MGIEVSHLDHLVLAVRDVSKTVSFYQAVLGMRKVSFGGDRVALRFGNRKINLHPLSQEFEPKARHVQPGSADLCFIIETPLEAAQKHLQACGVDIIAGPVKRTGAIGSILSLYFRDPDANLIEIANHKPE